MKKWIVIAFGACVFCTYMLSSCGGAFLNSTSLFSSLPSVEGESNNIPSKDFFYIKISEAYYRGTHGFDLLDYEMYESTNGPGYDCKISVNEESSTADMYCMFDVLEGDLFFHKLEFEYNAPPGMCDYVFFKTHWHYNQKSGYGPLEVYKKKKLKPVRRYCPVRQTSDLCHGDCKEGNDTNPNNSDCNIEDGEEYCLGRSATSIDEETCEDTASELCKYNNTHSEDEGENCCIGEYNLYDVEKSTTEPENEGISWGGNLRECIGGLGRFAGGEGGHTPDGHPSILIENSKAGLRKTYEIPAIIDSLVTKRKVRKCKDGFHPKKKSFVTANYWTGIEDGTDTPQFYKPDNTHYDYHPEVRPKSGYPYITFACKDQAHEIKHRIHLIIREWNSQEEFRDFKESQGDSGDPDVVGEAGGDCDYYEHEEDYDEENRKCNDMQDVDDWNATCGEIPDDYFPKVEYSN